MFDYHTIYQQHLNQGELRLPYCNSCQRFFFYPRSICPYCWGEELAWKPVSGKGTIFSFTVINTSSLPVFAEETPYIYAMIELNEGVRMPGNIIGINPQEVKIGMCVELNVIERGDGKVPAFKIS